MSTQTFVGTLVVQNCVRCGMSFGVESEYDRRRRNDHQSFFCPAGHQQCYTGKSEAEKLRDQLAAKEREVEQQKANVTYYRTERDEQRGIREKTERRLRATRGVVTRQKNKIARGQCPCCSHTFKNLRAHMKNQHPNWSPDKEASAMEAKS